jgi:hypothetical protein
MVIFKTSEATTLSLGTPALSFAFSAIVCLLLLKRTIKEEIEKIDAPFSLVARDPNIPLQKDKITLKVFVVRLVGSTIISFLASVPLIAIGFAKYYQTAIDTNELWRLFTDIYLYYYLSFLAVSLFASFILYPQFKNWHYTKHQF